MARFINRLKVYYDIYKELFPKRNAYTANSKKAWDKHVNLNWFSAKERGLGDENLGDYLSCIVVDYMKTRFGLDDKRELKKTKFLYAMGSLLHIGFCDATIWGSGYLREMPYSRSYRLACKFRKLDIRCVRGPKTREQLMKLGYKCPKIYGDPALLMPFIYQPQIVPESEKDEYCVVKHMHDTTYSDRNLNIMTADYKKFIDELVKYKKVISSSLHGIILAEAYGIPAVLYIPNSVAPKVVDCNMNIFKYQDYYYSTGRYDFPIAGSIEEAIDIKPCKVPDITALQRNLINTFPKDLWSK